MTGLGPSAAPLLFGPTGVRICVLDVETTGVDPLVDRIIELAVVVGEGGKVLSRQSWLIHPGCPIPAEASAVNGITDATVADAPRFEDVAVEILLAMENGIPAAYNARFDRAFVASEFLRSGLIVPDFLRAGVGWLDPLIWARHFHKYEKGGKKLDKTCERLGVKLEGAHRATADAEAALLCLYAFSKVRGRDGLKMPSTYDELVRVQDLLDAEQQADFAQWRFKQPQQAAGG